MMSNTLAAAVAGLMAASFIGVAAYLLVSRLKPKKRTRDGTRPESPSNYQLRSAARGLRTPEQIDEYHLVRRIHDGQNSRVWEVYDEVSEEHVAMKVLGDAMATDKDLRKSLRHEWQVARKLEHPNIIHCLRFVEDKETAYIVMELFASRNIKERILSRQKEFLHKRARNIMQQVGEGLAAMHAAGWVHRDVKPANILVDSDGDVRLIDFGLAEPLTVPRWRRLLPRRRLAKGTISYMSPEQIRGAPVDGRADIYCLGATFYEILTWRPPLVGQSRTDVLNKHLTEQPRPATAHNPQVTDEFAALLQWMLEKKPEQRPPKVELVLQRLQETPLFREEVVSEK
jgi:serine/threonine protein kinase